MAKVLQVPDDLVSVVRNALRARAKDMKVSNREKAERVYQLVKQLGEDRLSLEECVARQYVNQQRF